MFFFLIFFQRRGKWAFFLLLGIGFGGASVFAMDGEPSDSVGVAWIQALEHCKKGSEDIVQNSRTVFQHISECLNEVHESGILEHLEQVSQEPGFFSYRLLELVGDLYRIQASQLVFAKNAGNPILEDPQEILIFFHHASRFYERSLNSFKEEKRNGTDSCLETTHYRIVLKFYMLCLAVDPFHSFFKHRRQYLWYFHKKNLLLKKLKEFKKEEKEFIFSSHNLHHLLGFAQKESQTPPFQKLQKIRLKKSFEELQQNPFYQGYPVKVLNTQIRLKMSLFQRWVYYQLETVEGRLEALKKLRLLEGLLLKGEEVAERWGEDDLLEAYQKAMDLSSWDWVLSTLLKVFPLFLEQADWEEVLIRFQVLKKLSPGPLPFVARFALANLRHSQGDLEALKEVQQDLLSLKKGRLEGQAQWLKQILQFRQFQAQQKKEALMQQVERRQNLSLKKQHLWNLRSESSSTTSPPSSELSRVDEKREKWLRHIQQEEKRQWLQKESKESLTESSESEEDHLLLEESLEETKPKQGQAARKRSRHLIARVEAEIDARTWKLQRKEVEQYFLALGCQLRCSKGSHRKVTLPEFWWVEKQGESVSFLSDWRGMLILPLWADQVPFYLRASIRAIREKWGSAASP